MPDYSLPKGVTSVSTCGREFTADERGIISVEDASSDHLIGLTNAGAVLASEVDDEAEGGSDSEGHALGVNEKPMDTAETRSEKQLLVDQLREAGQVVDARASVTALRLQKAKLDQDKTS